MASDFGGFGDSPLANVPGFSGGTTGTELGNVAQATTDALNSSAFGGILSARRMGKYFTGARCVIKINGDLAGFAFAVSWKINTQQDEIWTIDDWTPYEIAPKRISVEGTLGMFHIPGKGPSKELIQSDVLSFMFHKYITIEVRDSSTDQLLFKTNKAVITSRFEDVRAEQLTTIQLTWKAIGWADEQFPQLPKGTTPDNNGDCAAPSSGPLAGSVTADLGNIQGRLDRAFGR